MKAPESFMADFLEGKSAAEIQKAQRIVADALKSATQREKLTALKKDTRLADEIEGLAELFYTAEFDKARNKAAQIWRALNVQATTTANWDWRKHLDEYRSRGNAIKMPKEWGFKGDDEIELERGLIYLIGARPGTGKTTIALNMAYYYALMKAELGYKVLFLTNEMKPGQCWAKLRQIDLNRTRGHLRPFMLVKNHIRYPDEFKFEHEAVIELCKSMSPNFAMASVRKFEAADICMVAQEAKNYFGKFPDLVFLDYLQRVPRGKQIDARLGTIETVRQFSEAAMDQDGAWFVLSQMNQSGGFKESEAPEEEAGIAWEISRDVGPLGVRAPFINWKIKKSRISAYRNVRTGFDDLSGTILDY